MMESDVIIIGSGVAGLISALEIDQSREIVLITKKSLEDSNSYLAQGGISALLDETDRERYIEDTLRAGHYKNTKPAVDTLVDESRAAIATLEKYGVPFSRDTQGNLLLTREGAHSVNRIRYCEDQTGKYIMDALIAEAKIRPNIKILENTKCDDLLIRDGKIYGVSASNRTNFNIYADFTILACGGLGGLFENTTNFRHICGDGIELALEHNIDLKDISYIQIHPTALYEDNTERRFLISESVRGEGAVLLNHKKERFTDELKPRDVVSKAILEEMKREKVKYEFIDFSTIKLDIDERFPNITKHLRELGYDLRRDLVPIVPAYHYTMGGIRVDLDARTNIENLYAVGEVACTGVHGQNRLASNSLLESVVFGKRCANDINNSEKDFYNIKKLAYSSIDFSKAKKKIEERIREDEKSKTSQV
ncbi:MAG: L-aspartate oxidase [Peptoniphilaceae bacterium]|nr:L-aspartate oxidase [Peptoniphilaceae bacterium]